MSEAVPVIDLRSKACAVSGCREVPMFGFGVNPLKGLLGVWACPTHYQEIARGFDLDAAAIEMRVEQRMTPKQGKLL